MPKVNVSDIKKLREETGAGVADCREALEDCNGDQNRAVEILRKKGIEKAAKKTDREIKAGSVFSYLHHNGKVGVLVALACETDFVAKTDEFKNLGKELALQIAAAKPTSIEELLDQEYVRDPAKKISELVKQVIGKLGENIQIVDFQISHI